MKKLQTISESIKEASTSAEPILKVVNKRTVIVDLIDSGLDPKKAVIIARKTANKHFFGSESGVERDNKGGGGFLLGGNMIEAYNIASVANNLWILSLDELESGDTKPIAKEYMSEKNESKVTEAISKTYGLSWVDRKIKGADAKIVDYTNRKELYSQIKGDLPKIEKLVPNGHIECTEPIWPQLIVEVDTDDESVIEKLKSFGKGWTYKESGKKGIYLYYSLPDSWSVGKDGEIDS